MTFTNFEGLPLLCPGAAPAGAHVLRLAANHAVQEAFTRAEVALDQAA